MPSDFSKVKALGFSRSFVSKLIYITENLDLTKVSLDIIFSQWFQMHKQTITSTGYLNPLHKSFL